MYNLKQEDGFARQQVQSCRNLELRDLQAPHMANSVTAELWGLFCLQMRTTQH